ncbi:MAG: hypothetical protein NDI77_04685 [Geobacteraceae bacterium]|nr:hypothetical protein [Geobacteraceae bacterium]
MSGKSFIIMLLLLFAAAPLHAEEVTASPAEGTIFTFWPLIDYRESPAEKFSNLSLLGPLFKFQQRGDERDVALRPFFYDSADLKDETATASYLYPLASSENSRDVTTFQVLKLFQKQTYRKDEEGRREQGTMLFPFYISGRSEKYGPYLSLFPLYGDIYERFWRDEYHYLLFPLYGRTVTRGTTTRNYLYPFFSTTTGDRESGFQFWPLYGESAKEGVYRKRFAVWPFFTQEQSGLDTDNPTSRFYLLPFYAATDSPKSTSRYYLWPFFGHKTETEGKQEEWDYFWPFLRTVRGENRNVTSILPLYFSEETRETRKRWLLWPLYREEAIDSDVFRQERSRVLYFLYSDNRESWPKDGAERRRTAFWPLFVYSRDTRGIKSLSIPAPVEPVLDREGIERNWAPFWRLYQQKWSDSGDSAASLLWNLYWHERRGDDLAYELFPLISYRSEKKATDVRLLKGLVHYRNETGGKSLGFFWLPFGPSWGREGGGSADAGLMKAGSKL